MRNNIRKKCRNCECYKCQNNSTCFECFSCIEKSNFTHETKTKCRDRKIDKWE